MPAAGLQQASLPSCDPGLAALGVVRVALLPASEEVVALAVIRTAPSSRKRSVLAADDNLRRLLELTAALAPWFAAPGTVAVCAEAQSWPRSASASAKVGMSWGAVAALAASHGLPILQASPQEVRRALLGTRRADKLEVRAALERRYPCRPAWPAPGGLVEHAVDAFAAIVACLDHPTVMMARRLLAAGERR